MCHDSCVYNHSGKYYEKPTSTVNRQAMGKQANRMRATLKTGARHRLRHDDTTRMVGREIPQSIVTVLGCVLCFKTGFRSRLESLKSAKEARKLPAFGSVEECSINTSPAELRHRLLNGQRRLYGTSGVL